jgi:SAM-dependent methyltransferase
MYVKPRVVEDISTCLFYHTMDLPSLGVVRGHWDLRGRFDEYIGQVSLSGRRVLDVGCATGYLSFSSEQAGAREVVSFDMDHARRQHWLPFKDKLPYRDPEGFANGHNAWVRQWHNGYWLCHRLLGSKAKVFYGDVYDLPRELGTFDVAVVGSVLEHLADPIRALASIARLTNETLSIVTPMLGTEEKIAQFNGDADRPEIDYVWWTYSLGTYRHVLRMLGFEIERITTARYWFELGDVWGERTTIIASRV